MSSVWKDLLFLHGHMVRKEDLVWRTENRPREHRNEAAGNKAACTTKEPGAPARQVPAWPRLAVPR